jgi:hypothetical protein
MPTTQVRPLATVIDGAARHSSSHPVERKGHRGEATTADVGLGATTPSASVTPLPPWRSTNSAATAADQVRMCQASALGRLLTLRQPEAANRPIYPLAQERHASARTCTAQQAGQPHCSKELERRLLTSSSLASCARGRLNTRCSIWDEILLTGMYATLNPDSRSDIFFSMKSYGKFSQYL